MKDTKRRGTSFFAEDKDVNAVVFDEVWVEAGFLEIFEKDSFVSVDYKGQNRSVIDGPCVDTEWFVEIDAKRFEHRWKQGEEFVWGDVWRGDGCFSQRSDCSGSSRSIR